MLTGDDFPLEVTLTPDSEVTDLEDEGLEPFKNFKSACLSDAVTSSEFFYGLGQLFAFSL